jgi:hypothetical protein
MRKYLLAGAIALACIAPAWAADWGVNVSDRGLVLASTVGEVDTAKGLAYAVLNIGFAKRNCNPEFGFAVLTTPSYGNPVGRFPGTMPVTIIVDNEQPRVLSAKAVKYSNGLEALATADDDLLSALSHSQRIHVKLLDAPPAFSVVMETSGAGAAISKAHAACQANR